MDVRNISILFKKGADDSCRAPIKLQSRLAAAAARGRCPPPMRRCGRLVWARWAHGPHGIHGPYGLHGSHGPHGQMKVYDLISCWPDYIGPAGLLNSFGHPHILGGSGFRFITPDVTPGRARILILYVWIFVCCTLLGAPHMYAFIYIYMYVFPPLCLSLEPLCSLSSQGELAGLHTWADLAHCISSMLYK